jgi:hypothetical protein
MQRAKKAIMDRHNNETNVLACETEKGRPEKVN